MAEGNGLFHLVQEQFTPQFIRSLLFRPPLADLPQDRCHALVVQRHELAILEFLELAEALAQSPRCLHLLGHEAHLVRWAVHPVVERRFDAVEALLCLLRQHGAQVRLEALVREVLEAVEADHFAIRATSCVSFYEQVCRPAAGVQGDGLVRSIQLAAADGEDLELGEPRLIIGVQQHGALARGGHVPDHRPHSAAWRPYQQRAEHLHAAGAPGQAQEGQAGLACDGSVDPEGVVHQHALRAAPQGQEEARGVRLQQRRTKAQVALHLLVGQDAAVRGHIARGRHRASEQLGEVRRGGVQGSRRIDGDILVQRDAGRSKGGQQRVVDGPQHDGGAPKLGGLHKTGGRKARAGDVGRQRAVLQGGDPAVDGRDRASEGVEGRHQRVAAVALGLAPAVRLDLDDAEVAQDPPPGKGLQKRVETLRGDVARQVLAPKPRSLGKSAAEGPNDRLQADLVDFSQNTRGRNKYGLVVQDVFTREIATKALPDKRAETVTRAAAEIIPDLVQEEDNYVVTTDLGNEFQGLEAALPGGAVHRQKDPTDGNATPVVDRAIQTLKKDL